MQFDTDTALTHQSTDRNPKVIIIGAGFAGLQLAKKLGKQAFDVLLLDKQNFHIFQPLLYQVATSGLEPNSIIYPVRRSIRGLKNVRFQMVEVTKIDAEQNQLITKSGKLNYDYLVIATGSTNNFFQFEKTKHQLLTLKSVTDALNIRSYILQNLEQASESINKAENAELVNIAIIGGGPAGVELAGALAEMKRHVLPKDFPELDFQSMSITLFEALPKLLSVMSESASKHGLAYLEQLGVDVRLSTMVQDYDNHRLLLADGSTFSSRSVIWTAGVKGNPVSGLMANCINPGQRIEIDGYFRVKGTDNIFALGDVASFTSSESPKGLPMLAAVAVDQANYFAAHFHEIIQGKACTAFRYKSKGVMATVGRNKAVVDLPHFEFHGAFAWFVWMFVHIWSLIGFRSKLVALLDWSINYFSFDRPLSLIIHPYQKPQKTDLKTDVKAE